MGHPPYSPDMNPCDFDLFAKMKLPFRGFRFRTRQLYQQQSVRRLIQEDAVDGIRRVVSLMCGGGFFILEVTSGH